MGWRDLIVSSRPREGSPDKPTEGYSVDFVDSVSKYDLQSSIYLKDSSQNSIPSKATTEYTKHSLVRDRGPSPIAPLRPGWLVAYRDKTDRLRGGCDERESGTVATCKWNGQGWRVTLTNGDIVPLACVCAVAKTDARGEILAAWTTREHGYTGDEHLESA